MSDPLALLPFALAAANGRIDGHPSRELVAAGVALLRRLPALPRALAGRRAGILLPPGPAWVTALAASDGRGAVLLSPSASPRELHDQLHEAAVGVVFTLASWAQELPPDCLRVLLDDAPRSARFVHGAVTRDVSMVGDAALLLTGDPEVDGRDEEALLVYTSAMAGVPLAAVLTHRNLLANGRGIVIATDLRPDDRALATLPLVPLFGAMMGLVAPLLAGADVLSAPGLPAARLLDRLSADAITVFAGVPSQYMALLELIQRRGQRFEGHALRLCVVSGTAHDPTLHERWADATGVELRQGYGLAEAGALCLFNRVGLLNHRGTLGVPVPGTDVTVRHIEHGGELPPKVEGEICVRGDSVSPGYLSRGEAGLARRDGWLRTGDRGVKHGDGTITLRGTLKPMVVRDGLELYPREVERVLGELPGVSRARVWACPGSDGEPALAAELWGDVTGDDVRRWCRERLSGYKHPSDITVRVPVGGG
jgi:long-chain acyl-CoA synthetase